MKLEMSRIMEKAKVAGRAAWLWTAGMYRRRPRATVAAGTAILLVLILIRACSPGRIQTAEDVGLLYTVKSSPLVISVSESGTIENREKVIIRNQIQGARPTIVWLIEEGKAVKKGDLLIEMDSTSFQDAKADAEIQMENATANVVRSSEILAVTKNQVESNIEKDELELKFAELALEKYMQGDYPAALQKAEADITIAREEVRRGEEKLAWSQKLAKEEFITRSELQADELAAKRDQINLQMAESRLELLKKYTYIEESEKMKSRVKQAHLALDRERRKAKADILQAEVDLRAKEAAARSQKERLDKILAQIEGCRLIAPTDGMVVYATSVSTRRWGQEPLAEGQTVGERQELIYLPTTMAMNAEFTIQEASLTKVKVGNPARIQADALPGRTFMGTLRKISVLPDTRQSYLNPDIKVYNCRVEVAPPSEGLRPGMSCTVEVIARELGNVLHVPIQTVLRVQDQHVVYVMTRKGPVQRPVEIGLDNNRQVHVISGLKEGEKVLLTPPLKPSERDPNVEMKREPTPPGNITAPPQTPPADPPTVSTKNNSPGTPTAEGERPRRGGGERSGSRSRTERSEP